MKKVACILMILLTVCASAYSQNVPVFTDRSGAESWKQGLKDLTFSNTPSVSDNWKQGDWEELSEDEYATVYLNIAKIARIGDDYTFYLKYSRLGNEYRKTTQELLSSLGYKKPLGFFIIKYKYIDRDDLVKMQETKYFTPNGDLICNRTNYLSFERESSDLFSYAILRCVLITNALY